VLWV